MILIIMRALFVAFILHVVAANFFDDFLEKEESVYNWKRVPEQDFTTLFGSQAIWLRVDSLDWNTPEPAHITDKNMSTVWTHDVIIIVPPNAEETKTGAVWLTDECDDRKEGDFWKNIFDYNILLTDLIAHKTRSIQIVAL